MMNVVSLRYSRAAGYLPASPIDTSLYGRTSYNRVSGGGGNCTRSSFDESCFSQAVCENCPTGVSEECRDDATLRELVASWHRLTPDVRAAIMQLVRGRG